MAALLPPLVYTAGTTTETNATEQGSSAFPMPHMGGVIEMI